MDYTIMHGDDNARVEMWMRINHAAHGGSRPAASQASGFWLTDIPDEDRPGTEGDPTPPDRPRCGNPDCRYCAPKPLCTSCHTPIEIPSSRLANTCLNCANLQFVTEHPELFTLPTPTLYCASCLCVAEQTGPDVWRCRNDHCRSVARLDELLTTSELLKRRAALERIKIAVFARMRLLPDIALGRELCALRWQQFSAFVAMLVNAPEARLRHYARSYVAYVHDATPESELTEAQVLRAWHRLIDGDDAGPAALLVAA